MKMVITLLFSLLCMNTFGYESLQGCFETVSFNGQNVEAGPSLENSESELFMLENEYYRDLDSFKRLDTLIVSVYSGFRNSYYGFSNVVIPVDKGTWSREGELLSFYMDEDLTHYSSNYKRTKVDFFVDASFKSEGEFVEMKVKFASVKRAIFYDFTAKLKRQSCL